MATLPDPTRSEAVLVGAYDYRTLPGLPAVARNLEGLRGVLTDPAVWGLPGDRCTVLAQPGSAQQVLDTVKEAAARATDTLLVYYGGHGLIDPHTDELYLALPESVHDREYTALRYEYLRRAVLDPAAGARRTVVVLDCCYSGRALIGRMSASDEIADRAAVEGTCLLTASAETRAALSPPGETYTAFTGELITALGEGIPGAPDLIDMNTLYRHLHRTLAAKSRPLPQQRNRNTGGLIALARNRAVAAPMPVPVPPPPLPSGRPGRKPSRGQVIGAAAAALVVIGGSIFAVTQLGGDDDKGGNATRPSATPSAQPLGDIFVAGKAITGSKRSESGTSYQRTYTDGRLYAPVTGYRSRAFGATGIEYAYTDILDGTDIQLIRTSKPGNVMTTIDPAVQKAAYEALGDAKGAAVAIDPSNGDILAMVSTPSYDASTFSGTNSKDAEVWRKLSGDRKNNPMLNRATRQTYSPGATIELVVAAAALEEGLYGSVDEATASPDPYTLPGTTTTLSNRNAPGPCENVSLRVALRHSCHNVFAKAAVDLGRDALRRIAEGFGFNDDDRTTPGNVVESEYPDTPNKADMARAGIGEFTVKATPLQMAMVSAVLANDGKLVSPHLVSKVTDVDGKVVESEKPSTTQVVSPRTAAELREAMAAAVTNGTSAGARIESADVGAAAATTRSGAERRDWCTAYAQPGPGGRQVAIAVVVEGGSDSGGSDGGAATPVARRAMQAAIARR